MMIRYMSPNLLVRSMDSEIPMVHHRLFDCCQLHLFFPVKPFAPATANTQTMQIDSHAIVRLLLQL